MSQPRDDWDDEERDALDGLEGELAGIRRRHADDPSLALLRAAVVADEVSWFLAVAQQRSGRPEARGRLVELRR